MEVTAQQVFENALSLPDDDKEALAERLVAYLETNVDPEIERAHIAAAKARRDGVMSGTLSKVNGADIVEKSRKIIAG